MHGKIIDPQLEQQIIQYIHYGNVNAWTLAFTILSGIAAVITFIVIIYWISEGQYLNTRNDGERIGDFFTTVFGGIMGLSCVLFVHLTMIYVVKQSNVPAEVKTIVMNQVIAQEPSLKHQLKDSLYGFHDSVYNQNSGPIQIKMTGGFWNGHHLHVLQQDAVTFIWKVN